MTKKRKKDVFVLMTSSNPSLSLIQDSFFLPCGIFVAAVDVAVVAAVVDVAVVAVAVVAVVVVDDDDVAAAAVAWWMGCFQDTIRIVSDTESDKNCCFCFDVDF